MNRVRVVGNSGSGKTTTAAVIAHRLGIPHLELDAVHWMPGWEERDPDDFRGRVLEFSTNPRWVIDGNYRGRLGDRLDHLVDTYIWLDLPRWRVVTAVLGRTIRRAVKREQLWDGNYERLSSLVRTKPLDNIVLWSFTQHANYRSEIEKLCRQGRHHWIRLCSRREVRRFLDSLTP